MIRDNQPIENVQDIQDTILYYQQKIKEWEVFKKQTTYFQSFAVENISILQEKITDLKAQKAKFN